MTPARDHRIFGDIRVSAGELRYRGGRLALAGRGHPFRAVGLALEVGAGNVCLVQVPGIFDDGENRQPIGSVRGETIRGPCSDAADEPEYSTLIQPGFTPAQSIVP